MLHNLQVYCFQSGVTGAAPVLITPAQDDDDTADRPPSAQATDGGRGAVAATMSVQQPQEEAAGAAQEAAPAAAEVAGAVAEMLRAAGLPLDLDRTELLRRALDADARATAADAAAADLRRAVAAHEAELEALRSSWACRVCFGRTADQVFVGCGHVFCGTCMPSLPRCPVCRGASAKVRLFR